MGEQRVRRAVELRRRNDASAAIGESQKGVVERRLTGGHSEGGDAALELRDAFLQNVGRRIGDAAVVIAGDFEIEHCGGFVRALEFIGYVLIDRRRDRFGRGIATKAAVNGNSFASHGPASTRSRDEAKTSRREAIT